LVRSPSSCSSFVLLVPPRCPLVVCSNLRRPLYLFATGMLDVANSGVKNSICYCKLLHEIVIVVELFATAFSCR
ncbi:hypothetical protein LINPERHAP1_LOCUS28793, partial [Linum perenne]